MTDSSKVKGQKNMRLEMLVPKSQETKSMVRTRSDDRVGSHGVGMIIDHALNDATQMIIRNAVEAQD
jgi:hypothetical protein